MTLRPELRRAVKAWAARDPDPETRREIERMLACEDPGLEERFSGRLEFGTAGLRAAMGGGPMRMNRLVVQESATGIARYLLASIPPSRQVAVLVAHDARHHSAAFAVECANVLAEAGLRVVLADGPLPTPVAVFATRNLGCAAGVVITASHNPPADNGLKLYLGDGAQIIPPVDVEIANSIATAQDTPNPSSRTRKGSIDPLDETVVDAYCKATLMRVPRPLAPIRVATSAMHGVGGALLARLLSDAGYRDLSPVERQEMPDPDFPTVAFPNPEEPGATDLLAEQMKVVDAPLGLCLDPDADRVAVLVRDGAGGVRKLTGDEVGSLLGEWLLAEVTTGPDRLVTSSVVSSSLLAKIAAHHGAHHLETLTGFKWLCRPAMEHPEWTQVMAYEEAIGYAIGADVRDKDGLSAALAVAAMASAEHARGRTLLDALDSLHVRHGAHVTQNFSLRYEGSDWRRRRGDALSRLTATPPDELAGNPILDIRRLAADVLRIDLQALRVIVRPSGTEPKLKCYCEATEDVSGRDLAAARSHAADRLRSVREALTALLVGAGPSSTPAGEAVSRSR